MPDLNALDGEWLGVASGRFRVPAPWFYMFESGDLGSAIISYRTHDKVSGFRIAKAQILNPATSVEEAKLRLARASRTFESSTVAPNVVREYWEQVISQLDDLPFPYLTIDATEILLMHNAEESAFEFARAFTNKAGAVDLVKNFSCFVENDPTTHAEALNGGFLDPEYRIRYSRTADDRRDWDAKLDLLPLEWAVA
jgi:hypothetical protein